jgi:ELWxxDGT repeat protein
MFSPWLAKFVRRAWRRSSRPVPSRPRAGSFCRPLVEPLEDRIVPSAVLVKDINPGPLGSDPYFPTNVNGILYFRAGTAAAGFELWRSDGTAAGTQMVRDINPGAFSSNPTNLTNVNGTLFFTATDPVNGTELWRTSNSRIPRTSLQTLDERILSS